MEKESCQNCRHMKGCIMRDAAIFQLFIVTGRDQGVPEAREKLNIRPSCPNWKQAEPEPAESGQ